MKNTGDLAFTVEGTKDTTKAKKCETFGYSGDTGVVFGIRSESVG